MLVAYQTPFLDFTNKNFWLRVAVELRGKFGWWTEICI